MLSYEFNKHSKILNKKFNLVLVCPFLEFAFKNRFDMVHFKDEGEVVTN